MAAELTTIERTFGEHKIRQREADGYLDATAMCRANKRKWSHYIGTARGKAMVEALKRDAGNTASPIIQVFKGNRSGSKKGSGQGTWVHPQVATNLAQWASPEFAVLVSKWVLEILTKGHVDIRAQPAPAPAPSADFARLESMVLRLVEVVAGIAKHIASGPRALPGQSCTVRQMCERTGWFTSIHPARRGVETSSSPTPRLP